VLIDTPRPLRGILIYGKAELDYDNVYQLTVSLLEKAAPTWPRDKVERFAKAYLETAKSVIVKVAPKRITTFDYTKDEVYQNLIKTYVQE